MSKINTLYQKHKISLLLFLTVGFLSALVNFFSFTFFWRILHLDYRVAVSLAYLLSIVAHFIGNRQLTFKSYQISVLQQLPRYLVMASINYAVTLSLAYWVVDILHYSPYFGIVVGIAGTVVVGYLLSCFWVFRLKEKKCDI